MISEELLAFRPFVLLKESGLDVDGSGYVSAVKKPLNGVELTGTQHTRHCIVSTAAHRQYVAGNCTTVACINSLTAIDQNINAIAPKRSLHK